MSKSVPGRLHIGLTADPELPVPPRLYGGIERIVDMLAKGLEARGHQVTLFAHLDSETAGRLVPWPGATSHSVADSALNAFALAREVLRGGLDLVHSFSRIAYLTPILPLAIPKLMTFQRAVTGRTVRSGRLVSCGTLEFTAASRWMMRPFEDMGCWTVVPNGVPLEVYDFQPTVGEDAPLAFLGRLEEIKGPHLAIDIARRMGKRLVLAGNVPTEHQAWFDSNIQPHIDGDRVRFVGAIDDQQKNRLLGSSAALLMPILWDEPFGIVMAEAMACGTPVLALNRGAASEVVEDGRTGFVRDDVEELAQCVGHIDDLERHDGRARVERLYSQDAVVEAYLAIYRRLVERSLRVPSSTCGRLGPDGRSS